MKAGSTADIFISDSAKIITKVARYEISKITLHKNLQFSKEKIKCQKLQIFREFQPGIKQWFFPFPGEFPEIPGSLDFTLKLCISTRSRSLQSH